MSHSAEKCKGGPFFIYKHAFCCKINSKGGPFGTLKKLSKKVAQCRKNGRDSRPFSISGLVCYAKKGTTIIVQFPGTNVQFGAIKFCRTCRTILVSSCGLKNVTIIASFHFMKKTFRTPRNRIVSKKRTDQCEDCSLKKKKVIAIVGHFSLKG